VRVDGRGSGRLVGWSLKKEDAENYSERDE